MFALRTKVLTIALVASMAFLGIANLASAQARGLDTNPTTLVIAGDRAKQIKEGSLKRLVVGSVIDPKTGKSEEIFRDILRVAGFGMTEGTGEVAVVVELSGEKMATPPAPPGGGGGGGPAPAKTGKWVRKLVLQVAAFNKDHAEQFIQRINGGQERDKRNASKTVLADGSIQVFAEVFEATNGPANFRVTMNWGDKSDVDLWITEPDGAKVGYSNPKSKNGGHLSTDLRQGPGGEEYQITGGMPGTYKIAVNLYSRNGLPPGTTHVTGEIITNEGTPSERRARFSANLTEGQTTEVGSVPVPAN
jgi:hypothetical protein